MDENKPPEQPTTPPTAPTPPSTTFANVASAATSGTPKGGPVPFAGPSDPSIPQDQKTQALLVWILSLFIGFISPLIFFFIAKDKPFVYHHACQALTFSIVMFVLYIISIVLMFVVIGIILMPLIGLAALAVIIMGAIAANAGSRFEPPVTGNLSKSWFKA